MDLRISPKFRLRWRLAVSCCVSSVWQFLTHTQSRRGRAGVAQWYVYWEALDNRKGGGCCWNVTTIDKKHGHELPYLDTHARTQTRTPTNTHARRHALTQVHIRSLQKERKNLQHCTGRDGNHSFFFFSYELIFYMENFTVTHTWGRFFFIGTAKAIRCVSQQQPNKH